MGLLEKAEKIQTDEKVIETPAPVTASVVEPKPVKASKKSRRERKAEKPKKTRPVKEKKIRVAKNIPVGFEAATNLQKRTRRFVDFTVSYGWAVPVIAAQGYMASTLVKIRGLIGNSNAVDQNPEDLHQHQT